MTRLVEIQNILEPGGELSSEASAHISLRRILAMAEKVCDKAYEFYHRASVMAFGWRAGFI